MRSAYVPDPLFASYFSRFQALWQQGDWDPDMGDERVHLFYWGSGEEVHIGIYPNRDSDPRMARLLRSHLAYPRTRQKILDLVGDSTLMIIGVDFDQEGERAMLRRIGVDEDEQYITDYVLSESGVGLRYQYSAEYVTDDLDEVHPLDPGEVELFEHILRTAVPQ